MRVYFDFDDTLISEDELNSSYQDFKSPDQTKRSGGITDR
jgi:hypothetical protein